MTLTLKDISSRLIASQLTWRKLIAKTILFFSIKIQFHLDNPSQTVQEKNAHDVWARMSASVCSLNRFGRKPGVTSIPHLPLSTWVFRCLSITLVSDPTAPSCEGSI